MMIVFTLIGFAATLRLTFEIILAGPKWGSTDAFFPADSGIQAALAIIENFDLSCKYINKKYDLFIDPDS